MSQPEGENHASDGQIFPAAIIEPLAVRWKDLIRQQRFDEATLLLEDIVVKATPMFLRMAQYHGFHHTVELQSLVASAHQRLPTWLLGWTPAKGRLFSWFTKCARNVFLSEVLRTAEYRRRTYSTNEDLGQFLGCEDTEVVRHEAVEAVHAMLRDMTCRWRDKQVICCIRFHIAAVVENPRCNKREVRTLIRSGSFASGLSLELSKFFYNWAIYALRDAMYDRVRTPYTEQDLLRLSTRYTYIPDMLNVITWQQMLKLITIFSGQRFRLPTISQLSQLRRNVEIYRDVCHDHSPDSMVKSAKRHQVSLQSAEEIYVSMARAMADYGDGDEHPIYD